MGHFMANIDKRILELAGVYKRSVNEAMITPSGSGKFAPWEKDFDSIIGAIKYYIENYHKGMKNVDKIEQLSKDVFLIRLKSQKRNSKWYFLWSPDFANIARFIDSKLRKFGNVSDRELSIRGKYGILSSFPLEDLPQDVLDKVFKGKKVT